MTRWFEDITIDEVFPLGSHHFTESEIIRFGQLYDPQYFHVDPEAAKHSHFGGLVVVDHLFEEGILLQLGLQDLLELERGHLQQLERLLQALRHDQGRLLLQMEAVLHFHPVSPSDPPQPGRRLEPELLT